MSEKALGLRVGRSRPARLSRDPARARRQETTPPPTGSYFCSFRLWFPSVCFHLRRESEVPAGRGCEWPHKAW